MTRSSSPTSDDAKNAEEFQEFLSKLQEDPEKEPVYSEIEGVRYPAVSVAKSDCISVLQSIYGDSALRLFKPSEGNGVGKLDSEAIRYQVTLR